MASEKKLTKPQRSSQLEALLVRIAEGDMDLNQDVVEKLNSYHEHICIDLRFSACSMILYSHLRERFERLVGEKIASQVPDFIENDYLEARFLSDPSDYGIVLALGIKSLREGNCVRARQLFRRVANSLFKERELGVYYLSKFWNDGSLEIVDDCQAAHVLDGIPAVIPGRVGR